MITARSAAVLTAALPAQDAAREEIIVLLLLLDFSGRAE